MWYDVFFSISQPRVDGHLPSEKEMFTNFFRQVEAADRLGFGTAWIAESHLSSEVQKGNRKPVIPHWEGEVGLNVDMLQLAHHIFQRTSQIEVGSAITNILCNGGPVAAAERVAAFLALHGLDAAEQRRVHVGFAAGRFNFMNEVYGVKPRNDIEEAAWRVVKGIAFREAATIFCRLLRGDTIASDEIPPQSLHEGLFRDPEQWAHLRELSGGLDTIPIPPFFEFERLKIVPQEFRRDLLQLIIGSHDPAVQSWVNTFLPVQVFNLSITQPDVIESVHTRMTQDYHPEGGRWERSHMPRTTFVFVNADPKLTPEAQRASAQSEAKSALSQYWRALQGTLDPKKVEAAANNALVGNPADVAQQALERFHPDDRLMLWFDFFNHDCDRVITNMTTFMEQVAPLIQDAR